VQRKTPAFGRRVTMFGALKVNSERTGLANVLVAMLT
jgi:hypothetical protein